CRLMYCCGSVRVDHPVRRRNHAPAGMRPCCFSHCWTRSTVSRKSAFFCTSALTSTTHAGPTNFFGLIRSTLFSGKSLPLTQWMGASKCVPVCSPVSKPFQYHAGPRSSYREIYHMRNAGVFGHCGGRGSRGVSELKGRVK